jgi:hypothetical protein
MRRQIVGNSPAFDAVTPGARTAIGLENCG